MREIGKDERSARRRAVDRLMGKAGPFETPGFEQEQAEAHRRSVMRLNAAAVMLNRALAEYSATCRK